jgi:hypothetical protein
VVRLDFGEDFSRQSAASGCKVASGMDGQASVQQRGPVVVGKEVSSDEHVEGAALGVERVNFGKQLGMRAASADYETANALQDFNNASLPSWP